MPLPSCQDQPGGSGTPRELNATLPVFEGEGKVGKHCQALGGSGLIMAFPAGEASVSQWQNSHHRQKVGRPAGRTYSNTNVCVPGPVITRVRDSVFPRLS